MDSKKLLLHFIIQNLIYLKIILIKVNHYISNSLLLNIIYNLIIKIY
jgi:hypothetical protein